MTLFFEHLKFFPSPYASFRSIKVFSYPKNFSKNYKFVCATFYLPWRCNFAARVAVPKALWKWGCISTFFLIFWQFQKVGGVRKSRPIAPFLDVIYLRFKCIIFDTFCRQPKFFYSISQKFLMTFFCTFPIFSLPPNFLHR